MFVTGVQTCALPISLEILAAMDRVSRMEETMDRVAEAAGSGERYEGFDKDVETLEEYLRGEWRSDFELDEAGAFPKDMKRGVLSEDGLYNVLSDIEN